MVTNRSVRVLVTGGTGFIGSHTVVLLQQAGYEVLVLDNLSNSEFAVLDRIACLTGVRPAFVQADVRDEKALTALFAQQPVHAVMHFAGLKAVGESVRTPLAYYDHNVGGTIRLLQAMQTAQVRTLIFSVAQVALGQRERLHVFGDDYPTPDGTGVRDYIHVMDLAHGHIRALQYCERQAGTLLAVNLGTGRGHSVLEMVRAFEQVSGRTVACEAVARRPGDVAQVWADASLAHQILDWQATRTLQEMCADSWRWVSGQGASV